ncbi:hypothetical protein XENOCAPTIV_002586, partial [Xenoophorus captivus]
LPQKACRRTFVVMCGYKCLFLAGVNASLYLYVGEAACVCSSGERLGWMSCEEGKSAGNVRLSVWFLCLNNRGKGLDAKCYHLFKCWKLTGQAFQLPSPYCVCAWVDLFVLSIF